MPGHEGSYTSILCVSRNLRARDKRKDRLGIISPGVPMGAKEGLGAAIASIEDAVTGPLTTIYLLRVFQSLGDGE
jgi:hypothetical protein